MRHESCPLRPWLIFDVGQKKSHATRNHLYVDDRVLLGGLDPHGTARWRPSRTSVLGPCWSRPWTKDEADAFSRAEESDSTRVPSHNAHCTDPRIISGSVRD